MSPDNAGAGTGDGSDSKGPGEPAGARAVSQAGDVVGMSVGVDGRIQGAAVV